jgi:hypothetical protein
MTYKKQVQIQASLGLQEAGADHTDLHLLQPSPSHITSSRELLWAAKITPLHMSRRV